MTLEGLAKSPERNPEYTITVSYAQDRIVKQVNELIKDGWRPQGGVSTASDGWPDTQYAQAMVRPRPE